MEVELIEIRDFLCSRPPFDALPSFVRDSLPAKLSVRYLRRGTLVPPPDADGAYLYIVRQGAIETRSADGDLIDKLGEGELFTAHCISESRQTASVTVEDSLLYLLPCDHLRALRSEFPEFADHFDASLADRLGKAIEQLRSVGSRRDGGLLTTTVGSLIKRSPVVLPPSATIRDAAECMTRERVSSLLIVDGERLVGLVTDRDLRSRCLAIGVDPGASVDRIMTRDVQSVTASTLGFEALMRMARLNVHHLPVLDAGRITGVISTTDLIRHESANAVYLSGDVARAQTVDELIAISSQLPELQVQLVLAGAGGRHVGEAVSSVNDAITRRLIQMAEAQLGAPPLPYVWVTGGSHARREQSSHSDQDNALIIGGEFGSDSDQYFARLARIVSDGLNACGFVYCPGAVMATNAEWRQPFGQWRRYFDKWIEQPEPKALMLSSVFFDLRAVYGDTSILEELQHENLRKSRANGIFLAHMVSNALTHRPPLGFFRNIVLIHDGKHDNTFDIKHRGVVPVVDLARVHALAEGRNEVNTLERLRAVTGSPALSESGARDLIDAYDFIATLRVHHQARQLRAGDEADNYVATHELSTLERSHLKDAFSVIATMQQALEQRYQSGSR